MKPFHLMLLGLAPSAAVIAAIGGGCSSGSVPAGESTRAVAEPVCAGSPGMACFATDKAVIANTGQVISNGQTLVDSYRSSLGPYGGANVGSRGDVQAATTLVRNGGVIHGVASQGVQGRFAPIAPPSCAVALNTFLVNSGQTATLPGGDYVATSFSLGGTLDLSSLATAPVRIWVSGTLILGGKANTNGTPSNLQFFYTGSNDVNVNDSGGAVFAQLYAPNAMVNLNEPLFGSVVGKAVTLNSGSAVHLDQDSSCVPPGGCLPTASLSLIVGLPNAGDVTAYVPNGDWSTSNTGDGGPGQSTGVEVVSLEGATRSAKVATKNPVNACVGNSSTGNVICTSNGTDVYVLSGTALTATWKSGAVGVEEFSGGTCATCGVAVDELHNTAILSVGVDPGDSGSPFAGGFQSLNLDDGGLGPPLPAQGKGTSEGILVDPMRGLLLSPRESFEAFSSSGGANDYQIVNTTLNTAAGTVYDFVPLDVDGGPLVPPYPPFGAFDSAGEDCLTGLALSTVEYHGNLFLADLAHAKFSDAGATWSAPSTNQALAGFESFASGAAAIAIAPNTHLGIVTGEYPPPDFIGVIRLPSALDGGPPVVVDWVVAPLPGPDGGVFGIGDDPHNVTAYVSPTSQRAFGVVANQVFDYSTLPANSTRTQLAVVDLQALLDAPRATTGADAGHAVAPTFDLVSSGVLRFVSLP